MSATAQSGPDAGRDRDRIVNLSDGIFAIAITLIVLEGARPQRPLSLRRRQEVQEVLRSHDYEVIGGSEVTTRARAESTIAGISRKPNPGTSDRDG